MHGIYPICKWQQRNTSTPLVFTIGGPSRSSLGALVPTHGLCIGRASRAYYTGTPTKVPCIRTLDHIDQDEV
jgi:hypothetical protein